MCSFCSTKSVGSASFRRGAAVLALLATASAGVLPPTSPLWPPVYDLGLSTITMQCNGSGWSSPERGAVRPFRRSIHRVRFGGPCCFRTGVWHCELRLVERQSAMGGIKADGLRGEASAAGNDDQTAQSGVPRLRLPECRQGKCLSASRLVPSLPYECPLVFAERGRGPRSTGQALPWFSAVREKLQDPAFAGWFIKFDGSRALYHVPRCAAENSTKCSDFYHDQEQTPAVPTAAQPDPDGVCVGECDCGRHPISASFVPLSPCPYPDSESDRSHSHRQ